MNHKTLIVPDTVDQINHNDNDDDDEAAAKMVTDCDHSSHGGCGGNDDGDDGGVGDGDGVAVIDLVVAWLSDVVTGTAVVARGGVAAGYLWWRRLIMVASGIDGGRRKYSPEKFSDGGLPEFGAGF
ncbi:hypothetical protein Tco_0641327 [Tanacetum coccineum]